MTTAHPEAPAFCGILPVNKAPGLNSFGLVSLLRKKTKIDKIGHAGTLDPFASGVMVLLIGRLYTRLSDQFLNADKQYHATIRLGQKTDTFDSDGKLLATSEHIPTLEELQQALLSFQGECLQIPPMFSAKKIQGKKLYELARKGIVVERKPVRVLLTTRLLHYEYPKAELLIDCSKGTYIRSLAHDLGELLGCGAHLSGLVRTKSGSFTLQDCVSVQQLQDCTFDYRPWIRKSL